MTTIGAKGSNLVAVFLLLVTCVLRVVAGSNETATMMATMAPNNTAPTVNPSTSNAPTTNTTGRKGTSAAVRSHGLLATLSALVAPVVL